MSKQVKRLRTLSSNKKGSIEIGINTIVIMVIAIVLLGLGVGFVKGIFAKMSGLTETISIDDMTNPPTSSDPIKINPAKIEVKSGEGKPVQIGVYNKESSEEDFGIKISECTNPPSTNEVPFLDALSMNIKSGEAGAFQGSLYAGTDAGGTIKYGAGDHICKLEAYETTSGNTVYETQFHLIVTT